MVGAVFGPFVYTITDNQIVIFQQILYENIISISRGLLYSFEKAGASNLIQSAFNF